MRTVATAVAVLLLVLVATAEMAVAEDAAGWRIYRDPATDQITAAPPGSLPAAAARAATIATAPALQEQRTADGTAAFVDLRGRFRASVRAERAGDGAQVRCAPAAP